jgi:hypothetical protein
MAQNFTGLSASQINSMMNRSTMSAEDCAAAAVQAMMDAGQYMPAEKPDPNKETLDALSDMRVAIISSNAEVALVDSLLAGLLKIESLIEKSSAKPTRYLKANTDQTHYTVSPEWEAALYLQKILKIFQQEGNDFIKMDMLNEIISDLRSYDYGRGQHVADYISGLLRQYNDTKLDQISEGVLLTRSSKDLGTLSMLYWRGARLDLL